MSNAPVRYTWLETIADSELADCWAMAMANGITGEVCSILFVLLCIPGVMR